MAAAAATIRGTDGVGVLLELLVSQCNISILNNLVQALLRSRTTNANNEKTSLRYDKTPTLCERSILALTLCLPVCRSFGRRHWIALAMVHLLSKGRG